MDISRLPAPLSRAVSTAYKPVASSATVETVASSRRAPRSDEGFARVVQGELLARERTPHQSTRSFINERLFEQAAGSESRSDRGQQPRPAAISQYLNHTRAETHTDLTQGRAVNFFV